MDPVHIDFLCMSAFGNGGAGPYPAKGHLTEDKKDIKEREGTTTSHDQCRALLH
jgi:hypothetical protein